MKDLGIITINHNRPQVLKLWCASIKRLRKETDTFIPAVVVSGVEDKDICHGYNIGHITFPNKPCTAKWNRAFEFMRSMSMDAVMILGSDDIVSTALLRNTYTRMEEDIDVMGVNSFYFYCGQGVDRGKLVLLNRPNKNSFLGIAKTVSKRVLDQCDWVLWDQERNWGMDAIANRTINKYAKTKAEVGGMVVDVKTRVNLNSFRLWSQRLPKVNPQEFYKILSEEELNILKSL
jgi:hypothetical protein